MKQLTKEQYWKLFNSLSEEMKDVVLSEQTAKDIADIGERNEIDNVSLLADCISQVLFGILPPNNLTETLEKDLGLKKSQSQTIMQEINRLIFYPIKANLEEIYNTEILPKNMGGLGKEIKSIEKEAAPQSSQDTYRESIE